MPSQEAVTGGLLAWIGSYDSLSKHVTAIEDLSDGTVLTEIMALVSPPHFSTSSQKSPGGNWVLQERAISRLQRSLSLILTGQELSAATPGGLGTLTPASIVRQKDTGAIVALTQAVLAAAVQCADNEPHINRIMALPVTHQESLMKIIESLMAEFAAASGGTHSVSQATSSGAPGEELGLTLPESDAGMPAPSSAGSGSSSPSLAPSDLDSAEYHALRAQFITLQGQHQRLQREHAQLQGTFATLETSHKSLQGEHQTLRIKFTQELNSQLEGMREENALLVHEHQQATRRFEKTERQLNSQLSAAFGQIDMLHQEQQKLDEDNARLQKSLREATKKNDELRKMVDSASNLQDQAEEIRDLTTRLEAAQRQAAQAKSRAEGLQDLRKQNRALQAECEELRERLGLSAGADASADSGTTGLNSSGSIARFRARVETLTERNLELGEALAQAEASLMQARDEADQATRTADEALRRVQEMELRLSAQPSGGDVHDMLDAGFDLDAPGAGFPGDHFSGGGIHEMDASNADAGGLRVRVVRLEAENKTLRDRLQEAQKSPSPESSQAETQAQALVTASDQALATARADLAAAEAELARLRSELADHQARQAAAEAAVQASEAQCAQLRDDLAAGEAALASLREELANSTAALASLREDLAGSTAALASAREQLAALGPLREDLAAAQRELGQRDAMATQLAADLAAVREELAVERATKAEQATSAAYLAEIQQSLRTLQTSASEAPTAPAERPALPDLGDDKVLIPLKQIQEMTLLKQSHDTLSERLRASDAEQRRLQEDLLALRAAQAEAPAEMLASYKALLEQSGADLEQAQRESRACREQLESLRKAARREQRMMAVAWYDLSSQLIRRGTAAPGSPPPPGRRPVAVGGGLGGSSGPGGGSGSSSTGAPSIGAGSWLSQQRQLDQNRYLTR
ncbi:hypothetical protein H696_05038 [Fonticula alba]|uniref:HOOK N-terminal domain-containing protein n=1 Tax=Fonticula alba TaxID=691883 RepID=A0A058Z4A2_FONAL|nr:hypothetical protein H696_05038 [Fonticula alba]KCV68753.1 hypothetical protein H696_05038 [Fonticula alba]|eukprot:XP_009497185.1 hypothetical protein H696_05038 [Fonticula alba]